MSRLNLTFACWDYDRVKPLADRTVTAEGIDLNIVNLPVEETFFRMLRYREFDLAEMSLSSYTVSLSRPDSGFVAIPVFPSRMFRHSGIFVSAASGIREPRDEAELPCDPGDPAPAQHQRPHDVTLSLLP